MRRAFKYRLWTNANQERELGIALETHRRLYNACLDYRKLGYETLGDVDRVRRLLARGSSTERETNPFYARLNFSSAQATMRRLDKAFAGVLPPRQGRREAGLSAIQGARPLRLDRVPGLRRRHPADRRPAPRPARRDDPGQAAPPDRGHDQDRHAQARGRQVVRRLLVRPRRRRDRAEQEPAGRHRRRVWSPFLTTSEGEHEPNPRYQKDALPEASPEATGVVPQEEGRQEPPQGPQGSGQGPRPCGEPSARASPPDRLEVGPSLRASSRSKA